MTLSSTTVKDISNGDGSTTDFATTFVFWNSSELEVILVGSTGSETTWTEGTQYSVTGGAGATGTVSASTDSTDYTPASGEKLVVKSNVQDIQETSLPAGGAFPSTSVEQEMDRIVRRIQQKEELFGRMLRLSVASTYADLTMPDPTAGSFLRWNTGATGLENASITGSSNIGIPVSLANGGTNADLSSPTANTLLQINSAGSAIGANAWTMVSNVLTAPSTQGSMDMNGRTLAMTAGTINMADGTISRPVIEDYGETINAIGSASSDGFGIDLESGNIVTLTLASTQTSTATFSNPPASGTAGSFTLIGTNLGSQTINWPASVDWPGGTAPTLTAAGIDVLTFFTLDGGTIWYGFSTGTDLQ